MRSLLIYIKGGKAVSVESGNRSVLFKKMRALRELPNGADEVQLWNREGGLDSKLSARKLKAKHPKQAAKKVAKKATKES